MTALPCDPRARSLRNATHWARAVSNQFDDACLSCLGDLRLHLSPITARLDGKTTTGGTVMIRIDGAQIVLTRIELTHTATLRRDLPTRLLRDLAPTATPLA